MTTGFTIVAMVTWLFMATWAVAETSEGVSVPVAGGRSLSGELFLPDGDASAPAIIILHTAFGSVERSDSDYARALAKAGFVALTVNYLHPETFNGRAGFAEAIVNDLVEAAKWLAARPQVRGKPIGTVGFSLGSIGLLMAARYPEIKAVIVYYGAYDPRKFGRASPASKARYPIDVAPEVNAATLLLHGDADDETPIADAQAMKEALAAANKTVELVTYSGAYHRFDRGGFPGMRGVRSPQGYTYRKDDVAAKDAFQRTIDWLKKHLGS